jgi:hypothetical protein
MWLYQLSRQFVTLCLPDAHEKAGLSKRILGEAHYSATIALRHTLLDHLVSGGRTCKRLFETEHLAVSRRLGFG